MLRHRAWKSGFPSSAAFTKNRFIVIKLRSGLLGLATSILHVVEAVQTVFRILGGTNGMILGGRQALP
jgi:hypothetical protein